MLTPKVTWCSGLLLMTTSPSMLSWPYNFGPLLLRLSSTLFLPVFQGNILPQVDMSVYAESDSRWEARMSDQGTGLEFSLTEVETMHQRPEMGLKRRDGANPVPCSLQCAKLAVLAGLFTSSSTGCLTSERRTSWSFSSRTQLCVFHAVSMLITWFQYLPLLPESMYEMWDFSYLWFPIYIVSLLTEMVQWILYREFMEGGFQRDGEYQEFISHSSEFQEPFLSFFPLQNQRF